MSVQASCWHFFCMLSIALAIPTNISSVATVEPGRFTLDDAKVSSACLLPLSPGNCRAYMPRFYFNVGTGQCVPFIYSGCRGNANNFEMIEDCLAACNSFVKASRPADALGASAPPTANSTSDVPLNKHLTKEETCSLPPVRMSSLACLAYIPSWTYNSTSRQCESYVYGGCGKTANLFASENDCKMACAP